MSIQTDRERREQLTEEAWAAYEELEAKARYREYDFVGERENAPLSPDTVASLTSLPPERQKAVESSGTHQNSRLAELERAYEAFTWGRGPWSGDMAFEMTQLRNRKNNL